jgi:hypothetical protein
MEEAHHTERRDGGTGDVIDNPLGDFLPHRFLSGKRRFSEFLGPVVCFSPNSRGCRLTPNSLTMAAITTLPPSSKYFLNAANRFYSFSFFAYSQLRLFPLSSLLPC